VTPGEDFIRYILGPVASCTSISCARAMNIAAANGESLGPPTFYVNLSVLGGEVDGNTALDVAPTVKAVSSIEYLLVCEVIRARQNGKVTHH
jgi:hypothetical protein